MSAYAYIQLSDIPDRLMSGSRQHIDPVTGAKLIAFNDCPIVGQIEDTDKNGVYEVEYPFPRSEVIRNSLVAWLMTWGICFRVVM